MESFSSPTTAFFFSGASVYSDAQFPAVISILTVCRNSLTSGDFKNTSLSAARISKEHLWRGRDRVTKTVAEKMGLKPGSRSFLRGAPPPVVRSMRLPALRRANTMRGEFDYLHLFVKSQAQMNRQFPRAASHLAQNGKLWVSWPKGGQLGTDLTLPAVIRIGYSHGMVESTTLSVSPEWSGMKFTRPKSGKNYRNSYGTLPRRSPA
jgi:hypothetical protein